MTKHPFKLVAIQICVAFAVPVQAAELWRIDASEDWIQSRSQSEGMKIGDSLVVPTGSKGSYQSSIRSFDDRTALTRIVFEQSPAWQNWEPADPVGPSNLGDAPVFLSLGPGNYWMFGMYENKDARAAFEAEEATLDGFDTPLKTTPFENQFDAPGGLKEGLGGYHAWQSRDMVNWVHHGPVTESFSRWVTSAEHVDGKTYIYYDYPNDQDPHLYIDEDLTDGRPGKDMGLAFKDPSDGSDCTVIRDLQGRFHLVYEDWSPINARQHSWDSPLAGHAVSENGISDFLILPPVIDYRTEPTGDVASYRHPHLKQHPDWDSNVITYEVHEPEQDAFGDWAAISIGGRYYLFGDFHPAGESRDEMRVAWFTSSSLDQPFEFCGKVGQGHPDPDIAFAEGQFYLVTQTEQDFVSPGPWVDTVEARVGVDTNGNGEIDLWTDWQRIKENYAYIKGFAKQVKRLPATVDVSRLPTGFGFSFAFRVHGSPGAAVPALDRITLTFE
ncbi:MAG: hypothetical protein R6V45_02820 [Oceanipulchritudo sp.]